MCPASVFVRGIHEDTRVSHVSHGHQRWGKPSAVHVEAARGAALTVAGRHVVPAGSIAGSVGERFAVSYIGRLWWMMMMVVAVVVWFVVISGQ